MGWSLRGRSIGDEPFIEGRECGWQWVPNSQRVSYLECRTRLSKLVVARIQKQYQEADRIRQQFVDEGATVRIEKDQSITVLY